MRRILISLLFGLNLAAIIIIWWLGSSVLLTNGDNNQLLIAFGRLAGLLGAYLILVQLLLISRWPFIEREFGFDKLNKLHRHLGLGLGFGLLAHPLLLTIGYAGLNGHSIWFQFFELLISRDGVWQAFIGLLIILLAVILTRPFFRQRVKYEAWHAVHLSIYVGIVLILSHQTKYADVSYGWPLYYWLVINFGVFGLLLFYRLLKPFILYERHRFYVQSLVRETHDVTSVYIGGLDLDKFRFEPGQYIHVSFLTRGLWEPHPFSLSDIPNGQYLRLSIKAIGDYTSDIPKKLTAGTKVLIEGPLGRFTEAAAKRDKFLLIAGGIGITPLRSLIDSLDRHNKDVVLLYGNKTAADIVFREELTKINRQHCHILSNDSQAEVKGAESGYIDEEKIKRLVPDFLEREIYLCGPPVMMDSIIKILTSAGFSKKHLRYEQFRY